MVKSNYATKLKDPRWQKKRLEILERDKWTCQLCGDTESTLMIHHLRYLKENEPWEYNENLLITLCEECHQSETEDRYNADKCLIALLKETGFLTDDIWTLSLAIDRLQPIIDELGMKPSEAAKAIHAAFNDKKLVSKILKCKPIISQTLIDNMRDKIKVG